MTKRRAVAKPRTPWPRPDELPAQEFAITPVMIKWTAGLVAAVLAAIVSWYVIWDRIDAHWRLESIQAAKDKEIEAKVNAQKTEIEAKVLAQKTEVDVRLKAQHDESEKGLKQMAVRAEVGRAWLFWSMTDLKAEQRERYVQLCKFLKWPSAECEKAQLEAVRARQEEMDAKRSAQNAGKGD